LRTLLIAMTVVAFASPFLAPGGIEITGVILVACVQYVAPICLGTCALYCRGRRQTFFLGAFAASLVPILRQRDASVGSLGIGWIEPFVEAVSIFAGYALCGYLALSTRRYIERKGWDRGDSSGP
jgi:hypothetical protein